jgi:hypothetical protein
VQSTTSCATERGCYLRANENRIKCWRSRWRNHPLKTHELSFNFSAPRVVNRPKLKEESLPYMEMRMSQWQEGWSEILSGWQKGSDEARPGQTHSVLDHTPYVLKLSPCNFRAFGPSQESAEGPLIRVEDVKADVEVPVSAREFFAVGMHTITPIGTIFNGLYCFAQNNPRSSHLNKSHALLCVLRTTCTKLNH